MARDLVLDVIAKKNSRDLSTLADEFDRLSKRTDDAGKKFGETTTFSKFLEDQIARTKVQVQELGQEVDKTGSKDLYAKLRGAQTNLKSLEGIKAQLTKALREGAEDGGDQGGQSFAQRFRDKLLNLHDSGKEAGSSFFSGFVGGLKPGLITGAIAAAAAVTPGALLAATGLTGIGIGIIGQLKNPAIHRAAKDTFDDVMAEAGRATSMLEGPLISAMHTIGDSVKNVFDSIDFGSLAKEIEPLASGIGGLIDRAMPGFNAALKAAGPIIDTLAADLPVLGDAISQMFEDFSKGGRGAEEGIHMLVMTLAGFFLLVGKIVLAVSNLTEHLVDGGERMSWWAAAITSRVPILGSFVSTVHDMFHEIQQGSVATTHAGRSFHEMGGAARLTADDLDKLNSKLGATELSENSLAEAMTSKVLNSMMQMDQAALSYEESLTRLKDAVDQNGRSLDLHTTKGQANRSAILGMISANIAEYQAMVANGAAADEAGAKYEANAKDIEKAAVAAYGNTAAVHGMIDKYHDVPGKIQTDIAMNGLTKAIDDLADLIREINGMRTRKDVDIFVHTHDEQLQRTQNAIDRLNGVAHGGSIRGYAGGGRVFEVGEMGKEYLSLPAMSAPAYVTPNSTINGSANDGGGGDLGTITLVVQSDTGDEIIRKIVTVGRRTNRNTFDTLIPVKTSR